MRTTTPPTPSAACRKTTSSAPRKWTRCSRFECCADRPGHRSLRPAVPGAPRGRQRDDLPDARQEERGGVWRHREIQPTGDASAENGAQGVIERIAPRRSLLFRSDAFREKLIAANVTQIIVVVAAEPSFSDELLARCMVAAYDQKLDVLIVLNKCDLTEAATAARQRLMPYAAIG